MTTTFNLKSLNDGADYLYYGIGANVIPANTKEKNTFENWSQWQDNPIPVELHEQRKNNGEYGNGIAVMTGRIHKGKNEGNYLVGIDCDNKKAIDEICNSLMFKDINELSNWTRVEQHKDNLNKAHIYILSTKVFKNKGRDPKFIELESTNEFPAIEIKCEKQNMFTAPSIHQNGVQYEILGTKEPVLCNDDGFENQVHNIFRKYGSEYLQQHNNNEEENYYNNNSKLPELLRQLIILLEIPLDFKFRILEGARHVTMISFANSLLIKHKYNNNISRNELKNFFYDVNNKLCIPTPLPKSEIESIWRDAVKFSEKKIGEMQIINNDEDDIQNYKTPIVNQLI